MGAFTPFKRNANRFNYTPRYYDPAKEEREQRREELLGRRLDADQSGEYIPGQYIRTQRDARNARRGEKRGVGSSFRVWIMLGVVVALVILGSALYNSIVTMIVGGESTKPKVESTTTEEEVFNPEATIIIVPNDYVEE
ncbi:MAG: hypothetical protein SNG35_00735 [Rikenellaceae bacterium]